MELFKLPKAVGTFEEKEMVVGIGRFGPYIRHDNKFVSIPKGTDPMAVDEAKAIELIQAKRVSDANRLIQSFEADDIKVLRGRFGAYIAQGKENYKIPKGEEPAALTLMRIKEIIAEADAKAPASKKAASKKSNKATKAKKEPAAKKKSAPKAKASSKTKAPAKAAAKSKAAPKAVAKSKAKSKPATKSKPAVKTKAKPVTKAAPKKAAAAKKAAPVKAKKKSASKKR